MESQKWGQGRNHVPNAAGYLTQRNNNYIIDTTFLYADLNYQLFSFLNVRLATRYDYFKSEIDIRDQDWMALPGGNPPKVPHGLGRLKGRNLDGVSPKAGLLFTPLDSLDIYVNYGRGLALPNPQYALFYTEGGAELAERDQYELGFRVRPTDWLEAGATYYQLNTN